MAEKANKSQEKLNRVIGHLGGCRTCRCKTAADLQVIADNVKQIASVLRKCRNIGDRILREGCGKNPDCPCQEPHSNRTQPCTHKTRVYVRWNK